MIDWNHDGKIDGFDHGKRDYNMSGGLEKEFRSRHIINENTAQEDISDVQ